MVSPLNGSKSKEVYTRPTFCLHLFFTVVEGLTRMTKKAVNNNLLREVGPNEDCKIAVIQSVDDMIFFSEAKKRQVRNLLFIWKTFEWGSGLKIIKLIRTSPSYFTWTETIGQGERLAESLGCKLGTSPIRYLGLPFTNGRLWKEDWWTFIGKFEKLIEGWQVKLFSQGSRLVLVNSVLSNLSLYIFSMFRAPKWVVRRIEALRRVFFWKGRIYIAGRHCCVHWMSVCRDRKEGGLRT